MDSLQSHPIRQPVVDLWNELKGLREQERAQGPAGPTGQAGKAGERALGRWT